MEVSCEGDQSVCWSRVKAIRKLVGEFLKTGLGVSPLRPRPCNVPVRSTALGYSGARRFGKHSGYTAAAVTVLLSETCGPG